MELIPIKTRILTPPKDNLYELFEESVHDLREGDVVVVTGKVVSIHEERCVPMDGTDKEALVAREAEYICHWKEGRKPLTIVQNAVISAAGIDESNGSGYYILLPLKPFVSAQTIHAYLREKFSLNKIGVVITDSHSLPFRYGAMSVSIGCYGFIPVEDHRGRPDLFGRLMKYSSTNIADSIAAASTLVSGECAEAQPITIARGVPNLTFCEYDISSQLIVPPEEDLYQILFKEFKKLR